MGEEHMGRGEERVAGDMVTWRGDSAGDLCVRGGTVQQASRRVDADRPRLLLLAVLATVILGEVEGCRTEAE